MPRVYFLYWYAAQSGLRGAWLRFQWFRKSLPEPQLAQIEALFKTTEMRLPQS